MRGLKDKRPKAKRATPLAQIDSEQHRVPSSAISLSLAERRLLKDPDWIDEDEADAIMGQRIVRKEAETAMPIRDYLIRRGRRLES